MLGRAILSGLILTSFAAASSATKAQGAEEPLDTVEVTASREKTRREILTFVHQMTRREGEFVGRWNAFVCPMVVGVSNEQALFIQRRLIEVQNTVRGKEPDPDSACNPNLFVIITDEADQVLSDWKERDPGMFRWKSREGVSRSVGSGPVRTWHNAIEVPDDGSSSLKGLHHNLPSKGSSCGMGSRITAGCWEHITAVVVLVDARATGKVTLAQLADYVSVVSLSQIDLTADPGGVDSILRLFVQSQPDAPPSGLTEWDYAFLKGLYRVSYSPANQQRDIAARMARELAPR